MKQLLIAIALALAVASSPAFALLNNTTADAAATTYVNTMAARLGLTTAQKASALANYKELLRALYTALKTDVVITIPINGIATAGSAAAQVGPPAPVPLSPD